MSTLHIQFQSPALPARITALRRWQPQLIAQNDSGNDAILEGYSTDFYMHALRPVMRRQPDPPASENDPVVIPLGHRLDDVFLVHGYTDAGREFIDPIVEDLYTSCLNGAAWTTRPIAPGITALPVHTHELAGEQHIDERKAWQLVGEVMDYPGGPTKRQLRGVARERGGLRVEWTNDDRIIVRGKTVKVFE